MEKSIILTAKLALFTFLITIAPYAHATIASETAAPAPPSSSGTMGGTAQAANKASDSQKSAQAASMMMAALMATQCGPQNPMACVMAALALAQGASLGKTSQGAKEVANMQSTTGGVSPTDDTKNGTGGVGLNTTAVANQLKSKGVLVSSDMKKVTLPDGKSVGLNSSAGTDAGMKANGFSDAQIAAAKAALADAQNKVAGSDLNLKGKKESTDVGGGGGGGASASYGGGGSTTFKRIGARKKPNLSGLSKNLGNDKIGVSGDDIFEMITRRYRAKDATDTFIKN